MAKRILTMALRMLSSNVLVMLIGLFLLASLSTFLTDVAIYQWAITAVFAVLMWVILWLDTSGQGQKDVQKDKILKRRQALPDYSPAPEDELRYFPWLGFAAGFAAQLPVVLLVLVAGFFSRDSVVYIVINVLLRSWNIMYLQVFTALEGAQPWVFLLFPVIFSLVAGLGYRTGPSQQARMEVIIERNKTRAARRVQDDKKKAQMRKKPTRR